MGGVARRATEIKAEKASNKNVLVLDAGNSLVGDRDPGLKTKGGSGVEAMNRMGYDAMALGAQDLTLGPAVLKERIAEAKFPILSANAVDAKTNELIGQPYVIREIGGHQVAIIGLTGVGNQDTVTVRDPVEAAKATVAEVAGKADVIILLSHAGAETDQKIADTVQGIDAIVGSGSGALPAPWTSTATGTARWQADSGSQGHAGRNVGIGQLKIDSSGKVVDNTWRRQAMGPEVTGDPDMSAWVEEVLKK